jgi:hypothetical protein
VRDDAGAGRGEQLQGRQESGRERNGRLKTSRRGDTAGRKVFVGKSRVLFSESPLESAKSRLPQTVTLAATFAVAARVLSLQRRHRAARWSPTADALDIHFRDAQARASHLREITHRSGERRQAESLWVRHDLLVCACRLKFQGNGGSDMKTNHLVPRNRRIARIISLLLRPSLPPHPHHG